MSVAGAPPPEDEPTGAARDGARPEPGQAEVDAAFAALVAGWDTPAPVRPERSTDDHRPRPAPPPAAPPPAPATVGDEADAAEEDEDEGHFEPPEPPALPRLSARALGGLVLLLAGVTLLVTPGVLGLTDGVGLPLGLLVAAAGLGVLLSRLRPGPDPDSGWDDGARL
ncbi:hypothetical protein GCM10027047_10800 [Rhodococcus aerolatus]